MRDYQDDADFWPAVATIIRVTLRAILSAGGGAVAHRSWRYDDIADLLLGLSIVLFSIILSLAERFGSNDHDRRSREFDPPSDAPS